MEFRKNDIIPSCSDVNRIDMVDYLASLGFHPKRVTGNNYWYLSPFRNEKIPSFKVNRSRNKWYDFGTGEGSSLIDFGIKYNDCTIRELLLKFSKPFSEGLFVPHSRPLVLEIAEPKIGILTISNIHSDLLLHYLVGRRIPITVAHCYCGEASFKIGDKAYYAICFKNDAGGYELRSRYFKGSSSPKTSRFIDNQSHELFVFEGFFDFLSYCTIAPQQRGGIPNFLVLNSLSFFEKSLCVMESHKLVKLFLNRDEPGYKCSQKAIKRGNAYSDGSELYKGYNDLNDWICGKKGQ